MEVANLLSPAVSPVGDSSLMVNSALNVKYIHTGIQYAVSAHESR